MKERNSYISSASVKEQEGRTSYYKMLESARQGELIQVRRGVYASIDQLSGNMIDINAIVPEGILCLWSAWSIHQLTTSLPQAFHVAIKRGRKITVPSFPKVKVHHYTEALLNIGVISMEIEGFHILIYDVERCVCDAVKFRNKVGTDVCSEIINNYLERPDRNLSKLMDYARKLRVGTILEQYLQVIKLIYLK
jgi:predicted transcriptional regulator of viral defense system